MGSGLAGSRLTSLEPFNAEDWKVRRVPAPTEPVLVIVSVGLAARSCQNKNKSVNLKRTCDTQVTSITQNGDATASTSCGVNPISKA